MPEKWLAEIKSKSENGDTDFDISNRIQEQYQLLFNEKTGFYVYDTETQSWQKIDDTTAGSYVYDYLGSMATARKINSVVELVKKAVNSTTPIETLNKLPLIPLKNGTLHFNFTDMKAQLLPASPSDYVTNRREYEYNLDAKCPEWLKALQVIFAGDERRIKCLQEFCGYVWLPDCRFQKALELRGEGSNGKSVILNVLKKLYGELNCTSIDLVDFAQPFDRIGLKESFINICTDVSTNIKGAEAILKKIITGESFRACYKMKDLIDVTSRAKLIFASNGNLETHDKSFAMLRRFLLIDCPVKFVDNPDVNNTYERKKDLTLESKLITPKSLSGILIWSLHGLARLLTQGKFTETAEQAEITTAFTAKTDSVDYFISECKSNFNDGKRFARSEIYNMYRDYCMDTGYEPISNQKFHAIFRQILVNNKIPVREGQADKGTRYYEFLVLS